jgi:hypothetical protein
MDVVEIGLQRMNEGARARCAGSACPSRLSTSAKRRAASAGTTVLSGAMLQ